MPKQDDTLGPIPSRQFSWQRQTRQEGPILANLPGIGPAHQELPAPVYSVSVVVPVYQGERTLEPLVAEIEPLTRTQRTPGGRDFRVAEVILVHDGAIDNSDVVMQALSDRYPFVKLIWLRGKSAEHPATLAGCANTASQWVVTLDEDGEQDPADVGGWMRPCDRLSTGVRHAPERSAAWQAAESAEHRHQAVPHLLFVSNPTVGRFHSFRMIDVKLPAAWLRTADTMPIWTSLCRGSCAE